MPDDPAPVRRPDDLADLMRAVGLLHAHGQATAETLETGARLARHFGLDLVLLPQWAGVVVLDRSTPQGQLHLAWGQPDGVNMRRVVAVNAACEALMAGDCARSDFRPALEQAATIPPWGDLAYAAAAVLGALMLAVIFGGHRWPSMGLIALSAGAGALLRRKLGGSGVNAIWQAFAAALLAGLVGALADHLGLTSAQRLVAVCPCMVLVPGPHLLNGCFDVIAGRVQLGMARLGFAVAVLAAIAAGVVAGLIFGGSSLPPAQAVGTVPLLWDIPAAAGAALAYGVFFAAPPRMFIAPMLVGAAAHAARWLAMHQADC